MKLAGIADNPYNLQLAEHGLISFTYIVDYDHAEQESKDHSCTIGENDATVCNSEPKVSLQETKVYIYPTDEELLTQSEKGIKALELPDGIVGAAWMFASKRDFVPQYDIRITPEKLALWKTRVGEEGKDIIERYENIALYLETMNYFDGQKFVLYFPAGSG